MSAPFPPGHSRAIGAFCLAAVVAASLSGCRPRATADPGSVSRQSASQQSVDQQPASQQSVNQQDIDNLNGILSSVGGAVTSVRSAMTADSQTPKG